MTTFTGTSGNDTFVGGPDYDIFHMEQGGNDTVFGGNRRDEFYFGSSFTSEDRVDGGGDLLDRLYIAGEYAADIEISKGQISRIEYLLYDPHFSYVIRLEDGFNGNRTSSYFFVGTSLIGAETFTLDGSRVKLVPLWINGAGGDDTITGGQASDRLFGSDGKDVLNGLAGNDLIQGGRGADTLTGDAGADRFAYDISDLGTPRIFDTITDFGAGDRIDLSQIDVAFHLGRTPNHYGDIVATYMRASDETVLRLFTDGDNKPDLVIHLDGRHLDLTPADFLFHG